MTLLEVFEAAPKSERTLIKRGYVGLGGTRFLNDQGDPCFYRIVTLGNTELGAIKYYRGRLLCAYETAQAQGQEGK